MRTSNKRDTSIQMHTQAAVPLLGTAVDSAAGAANVANAVASAVVVVVVVVVVPLLVSRWWWSRPVVGWTAITTPAGSQTRASGATVMSKVKLDTSVLVRPVLRARVTTEKEEEEAIGLPAEPAVQRTCTVAASMATNNRTAATNHDAQHRYQRYDCDHQRNHHGVVKASSLNAK
jgi:hypothetical protein